LRTIIKHTIKFLFIIFLSAFILAFTGCQSTTTTPPTTTTAAPTIKITSPSSGVIPVAGNVTVTVQVTNFKIVDEQGQANVPGEGHIHYYLDVDAPTTPGKPAIPTSGDWAHVASTSYTFTNVTGGPHKISVELVNNDHTPLVPPVVDIVNVTVLQEIGPPNLVIATPRDGNTLPTGDITVTTQISNFNVVNKQGEANVSHEGHLHFYLDVDAPTTPNQPAIPPAGSVWAQVADTTYTFTNITQGTHSISVELVNNDHTPLDPPVVRKITVNVSASTSTPTSATINLVAQNMAFNMQNITVPAGADVTINFNNKDGASHNFSLYTDSSAKPPAIFQGEIISGTKTITYHFTAPTQPGTYFFRCDIHPTIMTGSFIVN
jgi:plastocyanin